MYFMKIEFSTCHIMKFHFWRTENRIFSAKIRVSSAGKVGVTCFSWKESEK